MLFVLQQFGQDHLHVLLILHCCQELLFCNLTCQHRHWLTSFATLLLSLIDDELLYLVPVMSHFNLFYQLFDLVQLRLQFFKRLLDFGPSTHKCSLPFLLQGLYTLAIISEDWCFLLFISVCILLLWAWAWFSLLISLFVSCGNHLENGGSLMLRRSRLATQKFCLVDLHLCLELYCSEFGVFRSTFFAWWLLPIKFSDYLCCVGFIWEHLL